VKTSDSKTPQSPADTAIRMLHVSVAYVETGYLAESKRLRQMVKVFQSDPGPVTFPDGYGNLLDCAVVNYAFGIEVALKALCVFNDRTWPRKGLAGHDFEVLLNALPSPVLERIKAEYYSHDYIGHPQRQVLNSESLERIDESFEAIVHSWRLAFYKYRYRFEGHLPGGVLGITLILETILRYFGKLSPDFDGIIADHVREIRPNAVPDGRHWQELEVVWVRKTGTPPLQPRAA
jgi:hypothetical protein